MDHRGATDRRFADEIFRTIVQALEDRLGIVYEETGQREAAEGLAEIESAEIEVDESDQEEVETSVDHSVTMFEEAPENRDGQTPRIGFEEETTSTSVAQAAED
jgi:hypothetical protein